MNADVTEHVFGLRNDKKQKTDEKVWIEQTLPDGVSVDYELTRKEAEMSNLFRQMFEHAEDKDGRRVEIILKNIKSRRHLELIVHFMRRHADDPMIEIPRPLVNGNLKDSGVNRVDEKMFEDMEDPAELFRFLDAANYLEIESLILLTCAKIASLATGVVTEELYKVFPPIKPQASVYTA